MAALFGTGSVWAVALGDGAAQAFLVQDGQAVPMEITPQYLRARAPPVLAVTGDEAYLLAGPPETTPNLTHPVPLGGPGLLALIDHDGDVVLWLNGSEPARLAVDALPGARLLVDEQERVLLLTRPSSRYPHGIAGGHLKATEITLLETCPSLEAFTRISIPGHRVVGDLTHLARPERRRAVQVGGFDRSLVELMALRRTEDGIDEAWQTPVGGKAATNLASVVLGGGITLGVGRDDEVLRIWLAP